MRCHIQGIHQQQHTYPLKSLRTAGTAAEPPVRQAPPHTASGSLQTASLVRPAVHQKPRPPAPHWSMAQLDDQSVCAAYCTDAAAVAAAAVAAAAIATAALGVAHNDLTPFNVKQLGDFVYH